MLARERRRWSRRLSAGQLVLVVIGVITPIGILVVNASAFVMRNLAQFRITIAACALVSSLVLNGLTASWVLRLARRKAVGVYLAHPDWAVVVATVVVVASSGGAAYFTYVGMRDPTHLPNSIAVVTSFLAILVPLAFTYVARRLTDARHDQE